MPELCHKKDGGERGPSPGVCHTTKPGHPHRSCTPGGGRRGPDRAHRPRARLCHTIKPRLQGATYPSASSSDVVRRPLAEVDAGSARARQASSRLR